MLDNLLSNAVKYSRDGGTVTVCLRQVADGIVLEVTDTGMGIAPDEIDQVFGRFFRGGEALRAAHPRDRARPQHRELDRRGPRRCR